MSKNNINAKDVKGKRMHTRYSMASSMLLIATVASLLSEASNAAPPVTNYEYDANGNLTKITNGLGHATVQQYDALNRRIKQIQANPSSAGQLGIISTQYNAIDQVTSVTDPRNLATTYAPNAFGEVLVQTSPDTGATTHTYDAAGNLKTKQDAKGQLTTYSYDALNRLTQAQYADGKTISYGYDQGTNGLGRLTSMTDPTGSTVYNYDTRGRVVSEVRTINSINYTTSYAYNSAGQLTGVAYPTGLVTTYARDSLGRINQVTSLKDNKTQTIISNVAYLPFGTVKSFSFGNGTTYTRNYDTDYRISNYSLGSKTINLSYDEANRIVAAINAANTSDSKTYAYDNLDRLVGFISPNGNQSYGYDLTGNRTALTVGANTYANTIANNSNQLTAMSGPTNKTNSYDSNGSLVSSGTEQYSYDARGRLIQAVTALGTIQYGINALGQRVYKTSNNQNTVYHYDLNGQLIAETDGQGIVKQETIYLGNIPIAVLQ